MIEHRRVMLLLSLVGLLNAGCTHDPVESLVEHAEAIDDILADHIDSPKRGATEVRAYYRAHLPNMLENAGHLLVELDGIEDPEARQKRAQKMLEALLLGIADAMPHAGEFRQALQRDSNAQAMLKEIGSGWTTTIDAIRTAGLPRL